MLWMHFLIRSWPNKAKEFCYKRNRCVYSVNLVFWGRLLLKGHWKKQFLEKCIKKPPVYEFSSVLRAKYTLTLCSKNTKKATFWVLSSILDWMQIICLHYSLFPFPALIIVIFTAHEVDNGLFHQWALCCAWVWWWIVVTKELGRQESSCRKACK